MTDCVLVVEDEQEISDLLRLYLENEGFRVVVGETGAKALALVESDAIDLGILDVMLPDMNGFDLCGKLRQTEVFPIIMLTAKNTDMDKIHGLTMGADDYVTKPFQPLELVARVKAQLRRHTNYSQGDKVVEVTNVFESKGLTVKYDNHQCFVNGHEVKLTPKEFGILSLMTKHPGQVMSSEELFAKVWGEAYYESATNTIMVHIRHIREKLKVFSPSVAYITTVWGVGYKFEE